MRSAGRIFVDHQPQNIAAYNQLSIALASAYGTSRTATRIRLRELWLVEDHRYTPATPTVHSGPVAIGSILAELLAKVAIQSDVGQ